MPISHLLSESFYLEQEQKYNVSNQRHVQFDEHDTVFEAIGGDTNNANVHSYGKITQQNPFEPTQGRTASRNFSSRYPYVTNGKSFEVYHQ